MSFSTYIKAGTGLGLTTGLITSAYFAGATNRLERESNPGFFGSMILSIGSAICGGPAGAVLGAGLYGMKRSIQYVRAAPRPVQTLFAAALATSIATTAAYEFGNKKHHQD